MDNEKKSLGQVNYEAHRDGLIKVGLEKRKSASKETIPVNEEAIEAIGKKIMEK